MTTRAADWATHFYKDLSISKTVNFGTNRVDSGWLLLCDPAAKRSTPPGYRTELSFSHIPSGGLKKGQLRKLMRPVPQNNQRRRASTDLSYSHSSSARSANQLQHRAQPASTRYPIQSRDATAELGHFALGHGSLLEQGWQNGLYQCPGRKDRYGPAFRRPFHKRRCLIPANGFYEWKKTPARENSLFYRNERCFPFRFRGSLGWLAKS